MTTSPRFEQELSGITYVVGRVSITADTLHRFMVRDGEMIAMCGARSTNGGTPSVSLIGSRCLKPRCWDIGRDERAGVDASTKAILDARTLDARIDRNAERLHTVPTSSTIRQTLTGALKAKYGNDLDVDAVAALVIEGAPVDIAVKSTQDLAITTDLERRALFLGYTRESAYRMANCLTNWNMVSDPCAKHPNHSKSVRDGYAVDDCEACEVIRASDEQGYTVEVYAATVEANRACAVWFGYMDQLTTREAYDVAADVLIAADYVGKQRSEIYALALELHMKWALQDAYATTVSEAEYRAANHPVIVAMASRRMDVTPLNADAHGYTMAMVDMAMILVPELTRSQAETVIAEALQNAFTDTAH